MILDPVLLQFLVNFSAHFQNIPKNSVTHYEKYTVTNIVILTVLLQDISVENICK